MILTNKSVAVDAPPPAYDTLSIHQSQGIPSIPNIINAAGPSSIVDVYVEPPHTLPRSMSNININSTDAVVIPKSPLKVEKSLPERPLLDTRQTLPASAFTSFQKRKHSKARRSTSPSSWLSILPFTSSRATKQVRQSVLTLIQDLVVPPPTNCSSPNSKIPPQTFADPHEVLASCAESCSARNLSLSALLQEVAVADHTPIYWAIVNFRPSLLDAFLRHAMPLTPATLSEMRKACLVASNQVLFHKLRLSVGLCASGMRSATDGLLLGQRPPDDVRIEQGPDGAFVATLDIAMWQKRIRAIGSVSVEFIASGRIFALTFFSTDHSQSNHKSPKSKRAAMPWHVSLSLLEHSLPTYMDAVVIIDRPPPIPSPGPAPSSPREKVIAPSKGHIHSASYSGGEKGSVFENGGGFASGKARRWDFNYDGLVGGRASSPSPPSSPNSPGSSTSSGIYVQTSTQKLLPPPARRHHTLVQTRSSPLLKQQSSSSPSHMITPILDKTTARTPRNQLAKLRPLSLTPGWRAPVVLRLCANEAMIACRTKTKNGDPCVPDTWWEHGKSYVSAVVVPLKEQGEGGLMFDASPHLAHDGSLRARLEAKLVRTAVPRKECIIC